MKEFDTELFVSLPRKTLVEMSDAGDRALECHRILNNTDDNIVGELIKNIDTFYEWNHYPDGDVYDNITHSQYYYHAHPPEERPGEHGHFHTFIRPDGMPEGMSPAAVPDYEPPEDPDDALSHIVAISTDSAGLPIKLFTTNRWVTGEVWYTAADVHRLIDRFQIDHAQPSWPVNLWVSSMVRLFDPQIRALVAERDRVVAAWEADHPASNVFEDRDLEVTSEISVDIDAQRVAIEAALDAQSGNTKER
ncbi:MAG: hypothetical protein GKS00_27235 [Alphaproteobacteria bacterium]|nr:hypothetical protein [Alphaproteobacteria bacterium]